MKNIKTFFVSLVLFSLLPTLAFSKGLIGHWSLVGISCGSGHAPQPGFDPKTRYDFIFYPNYYFENPVVAPGTWMVFRGFYSTPSAGFCLKANEKLEALKAPAPHQYQRCFQASILNQRLVVSFTSEGSDDNCAKGDLVRFHFNRLSEGTR